MIDSLKWRGGGHLLSASDLESTNELGPRMRPVMVNGVGSESAFTSPRSEASI